MLQFLRFKIEFTIAKLQFAQRINNYRRKYSNNYYQFNRCKKISRVKKLSMQKYINYTSLKI